MKQEEYFNRSILRALMIIELFVKERRPMGVGEVSRLINLSKSTTHRLILTLESRGWLWRSPENDKYRMGIKFLTFSSISYEGLSSCKEIHHCIQSLSDDINESVILSIWNGDDVVCVDKIEASQSINVSSKIGQCFPIHAGASGLAVLMTMDEETVKGILNKQTLEKYTQKTIIDPDILLQRYFAAKDDGYVISSGEKDEGVTSIACGVFFPYEQVHASIAVVLPDSRATSENQIVDIKNKLIKTKEKIAVLLGTSVLDI